MTRKKSSACDAMHQPGQLDRERGAAYLWHMTNEPLTVIYNGACPICAREIAHYRARAEHAGVTMRFADLTETDLTAYRLTPDAAARRLHVAAGDRLVSGLDAFVLIWSRLPGLRWLARAALLPGLHPLLDVAYNRVAAPWLYLRHLRRTGRA